MSACELPLFPLNTVLFPGWPLALHVFEERYRELVSRCLKMEEPFGVALIRSGVESHGPLAEPHEIGCTARIIQTERLSQGRINIVAVGQERFRILSVRRDRPYLVGDLQAYPLVNEDPNAVVRLAGLLRPLVKRYMRAMARALEDPGDLPEIPSEPLPLAYLGATLLQVPLDDKQQLLAIPRTEDLLESLASLYRQELPILAAMLTPGPARREGPFSVN